MPLIDYRVGDVVEVEDRGPVRVERRWTEAGEDGFDGEEIHEVCGEYIARIRGGRPVIVWGLDEDVVRVIVRHEESN